jgi:hypothetical protein
MSDKGTKRLPYELPEIGLGLELHSEWPILSLDAVGAKGIYQQVADTTGIVFVRYGGGETVAVFVGQLGDMLTDVIVLRDKPVTFAGKDGRHVKLNMITKPHEVYWTDDEAGVAHKTLPMTHTVISVIGFSHRSIPILVGYRMPDDELKNYESTLEGILTSVTLS